MLCASNFLKLLGEERDRGEVSFLMKKVSNESSLRIYLLETLGVFLDSFGFLQNLLDCYWKLMQAPVSSSELLRAPLGYCKLLGAASSCFKLL